MASLGWRYVGKCDPERLKALAERLSFPQVVDEVNREMKLRCFHHQPRTDDPSYSRPVYCVEIGESLFDAFFNSELGYRGQYFVSPDTGLEANCLLLTALCPALVSWTLRNYASVDVTQLAEALCLPSAKAWLSEGSLKLCAACSGEWAPSYQSELQIQNDRWERSDHLHATWGRQAPRFTTLRLFGGFVNAEHKEWVADHKLRRARQIWAHGWS